MMFGAWARKPAYPVPPESRKLKRRQNRSPLLVDNPLAGDYGTADVARQYHEA